MALKPCLRSGRNTPQILMWSPGWHRRVCSPAHITLRDRGMLPTGTCFRQRITNLTYIPENFSESNNTYNLYIIDKNIHHSPINNLYLIGMFLYFNFLEFHEFGASSLEVKTPSRLVDPAIVTGALELRHEACAPDLPRHRTVDHL